MADNKNSSRPAGFFDLNRDGHLDAFEWGAQMAFLDSLFEEEDELLFDEDPDLDSEDYDFDDYTAASYENDHSKVYPGRSFEYSRTYSGKSEHKKTPEEMESDHTIAVLLAVGTVLCWFLIIMWLILS